MMSLERTKELRKELWKQAYAENCFNYVIFYCKHIKENNLKDLNPLYYSLSTSICINYSKPFLNNWGVGKNKSLIIPEEYVKTHKTLIALRDKSLAHIDSNSSITSIKNEIKLIVDENGLNFDMSMNAINYDHIDKILTLVNILRDKSKYWRFKNFTKLKDICPQLDGEYILNVDDNIGETFIKT
jgi:hypothetical protein